MMKTLPVVLLKQFLLLPKQEVKVELNNPLTTDVITLSCKDYESEVLVVLPNDILEEEPLISDLPMIGVTGYIKSKIKLPNGHLRVRIVGQKRVKIMKYFNDKKKSEVLCAKVCDIEKSPIKEEEELALIKKLKDIVNKYIEQNPFGDNTISNSLNNNLSLNELTDLITAFLPLSLEKKLNYMVCIDEQIRAYNLIKDLNVELQIIKLDQQLSENLQKELEKNQKEFILREKIKEIKKELGEENEKKIEGLDWQAKLKQLNLDKKIEDKINREIIKYEKMNEMSPDASFVRNYLETFFNLPWNKYSQDETDLNYIQMTLDKSHYGLEEIKKRMIEYIAVKKRNPNLRSPILCLVGPPGVGKTTIAMSIAKALNKEFYKISLGGLNDATELSGHRRTYLGSSPGKIVEALIKCGTKNPVILLDEVDKIVKDYRGDPASVLLDALDYPQNMTFTDNYIEEPFDLSNVLFILTANDLTKISRELIDRLEIMELTSYTFYEKITLAKDYLLPQIYDNYNLSFSELTIPDGVIGSVITHYTKEAGVRDLKRKLDALVRKIVTNSIKSKRKLKITLQEKDLKKYLDDYQYDNDLLPKTMAPGLTNALAWTSFGGKVLSIEACSFEGSGKIITTGSLKEIMKESIDVAIDYIKSHQRELQVNTYFFQTRDLHLHAMDGSTPKNGPSAGVAIVTSLISLFHNQEISKNIAMTGEITLRGDILPVGGIKEKLIGAFNASIQTVFIPKENKKDLKKVPDYVKDNMNIILVENYREIYKHLFTNNPKENRLF